MYCVITFLVNKEFNQFYSGKLVENLNLETLSSGETGKQIFMKKI